MKRENNVTGSPFGMSCLCCTTHPPPVGTLAYTSVVFAGFLNHHKFSESTWTVASTYFRPSEGGCLQYWPLGKATHPQMFGLSSKGGRTRLGQRPPLRLRAFSPPRLLGTAVLPAVPGLASHSTPCRPCCQPAALCVVTQSAAQVTPETAVERSLFIVKKMATENKQKISVSPQRAASCR